MQAAGAARLSRMQTDHRPDWAFRIALTLGIMLGLGWGFLLGVALVRINLLFLLVGMVIVGLPAVFLGNVFVSAVFQRMVPGWRKTLRLVAVIWLVAASVPLGLAWAMWEYQVYPIQLLERTGIAIWYADLCAALLGVIGGTWTGWARPVTWRWNALIQFIASIPGRILAAIGRFFETAGHAFLWLPLQIGNLLRRFFLAIRDAILWLPSQFRGLVSGPYNRAREQWMHLRTPTAAPTRSRRRRAAPTARRSRERRIPKRRATTDDGFRVIEVVEDRCPYCLDVIKKDDPRGVTVCEVCGTPHHADCWAITGKCQVPHLNT